MAVYQEKFYDNQDIPAPDDLIAGEFEAHPVILKAGEYKRGMLLMSSGDNEFEPAASEGISSASELAVCAKTITVPKGDTAESTGYFDGNYNGGAVVLAYETEADDHNTAIDLIIPALRKHRIFIR